MSEYSIVAVLWNDHRGAHREELPTDIDDFLGPPTLSVGFVLKETDKSLLIVSEVERYEDRDDATYTVILKTDVVGRKEYGRIELEDIRYANYS